MMRAAALILAMALAGCAPPVICIGVCGDTDSETAKRTTSVKQQDDNPPAERE